MHRWIPLVAVALSMGCAGDDPGRDPYARGDTRATGDPVQQGDGDPAGDAPVVGDPNGDTVTGDSVPGDPQVGDASGDAVAGDPGDPTAGDPLAGDAGGDPAPGDPIPGDASECGNGTQEPGEECDTTAVVDCASHDSTYYSGNDVLCTSCSWDTTACAWCGDGVLEVTAGEECDDGNTCDGDGCGLCTREPSAVVAQLVVGDGTIGFDLDNLDGDGDIHTGVDNLIGANGLVRDALNGQLTPVLESGGVILVFAFDDLDSFVDDPDIAVSMFSAVDPACTTTAPVPWVDAANAPWQFFSNADVFTGCAPPLTITDADHPMNGIYPLAGVSQPPAPVWLALVDEVPLALGGLGTWTLHDVAMESTVVNDGTELTALNNGVIGGRLGAEVLYAIDTSTTLGSNCPTLLHAVLAFVGTPDQDIDGGGLESLQFTFGKLPCILSSVSIQQCQDEDGTTIDNTSADGDCVLDPRIADGYSLGFTFTAPAAHVIGQVPASHCP